MQHKAIVYNLVDRAILLSNKKFHDKNIKIIQKNLNNNDYPDYFIQKHIKIRLNKIKYNKSNIIDKKCKKQLLNRLYAHQPKVFLPYHEDNYKKLSNIFKSYNIHTIPLINKNLTKVIKLGKDKTEKTDTPEVVYQIECNKCTAVYIGQTKRQLFERLDEHSNNKNLESVICAHQVQNKKHKFKWDEVKILDKEPIDHKRLLSEMIFINKTKNTINKKEDISKLDDTYKVFLNSLLN